MNSSSQLVNFSNAGKVKITVQILGYLPFKEDLQGLKYFVSDLIEQYIPLNERKLPSASDLGNWEYSDQVLKELFEHDPHVQNEITVFITFVPMENNFFMRLFEHNTIVISFSDIASVLDHYNIPLKNLVRRLMYCAAIQYKITGNYIPNSFEDTLFHEETKGCIFDLNARKFDIHYSTDRPCICSECNLKILSSGKINDKLLKEIKLEIKSIKKAQYYRMADYLKKNIIFSIIVSALTGMALSIITNIIWEYISPFFKK